MKRLNLGCGGDYRKDWINVDCRNNIIVDKKVDLEKYPYPFKNNEFDETLISHVLEHLSEPIKTLKEIARISKNNAKIVVNVPHATSYANIASIQHKANFTEHSFTKEHLIEYDLEELELTKMEFVFRNKWKKFIPLKQFLKIFIMGLYDDLRFEFRVKK